MKKHFRMLLLAGAAVFVLGAGPDTAPDTKEPTAREAVVTYWTPERMTAASSTGDLLENTRDLIAPLAASVSSSDEPATILSESDGASWEAGGQVQQATGRVFFSLRGRDRVCTGTVVRDFRVDRAMVLTAGHCAYDPVSGQFATNWMFIPAFDDSPVRDCNAQKFGCWTADHFVTSRKFANGNLEGDYAFVVLGAGGHGGQIPLDAVVNAQPVVFEKEHPAQVYTFGYPSAGEFGGNDLFYCAGMTVADGWGKKSNFGVRCSMSDGASGGPWMVDFNQDSCSGSVNSVTSFRYAAGPFHEYLFGPYFDAATRRAYVAAQSSSGNQIVN